MFICNIIAFWPSADVKPIGNDLMHAMPWQCMFALSLSLSLCVCGFEYWSVILRSLAFFLFQPCLPLDTTPSSSLQNRVPTTKDLDKTIQSLPRKYPSWEPWLYSAHLKFTMIFVNKYTLCSQRKLRQVEVA